MIAVRLDVASGSRLCRMEVISQDMKARTKEPPIGWVNNFVLSCSPLDCGLLGGGGPSISTKDRCKDRAKERQKKTTKKDTNIVNYLCQINQGAKPRKCTFTVC